ncbi:hypothetical protein EOM81_12820 [bacterium]|nr:hypothetical protein [bacterium]
MINTISEERAKNSEKTKLEERAIVQEKNIYQERAELKKESNLQERAINIEKTNKRERAEKNEKTTSPGRANTLEKTICDERPTFQDVLAVRTLVRAREDFQGMRKKMDNRMGMKADGTEQNLTENTARNFNITDIEMFKTIADECRRQESEIEKMLKKTLKRFPIYTDYLLHIKGVGTIAAGWIIAEFDIHKATTVSKMWQFAGLNPGLVKGKKRVEDKDGNVSFIPSGEMIRGDKLSPGHVAPFNQNLRTALVGVLADGFIKQQNQYCMDFYYPYKARLEQEESQVLHIGKDVAWSEVSKGHRDRAAKRYMIKMFLKDLYVAWRELEGLEVRVPYQEEYLGHKH